MKLRSGITKEWLRKMRNEDGQHLMGEAHSHSGEAAMLVDRKIWVDEYGRWHETKEDGKEIIYPKEQAQVVMHDARKDNVPAEHRICGFWLKLDGLWVAPMVCIGYKNNPATAQVVFTDEKETEDGGKIFYSETLILDEVKGARIHVANTELDKDLKLVKEGCWEHWQALE